MRRIVRTLGERAGGAACWIPLSVAVLGLAFTVLIWQIELAENERQLTARFDAVALDRAAAVQREFEADLSVVSMLAALVGERGQLDEGAFLGVSSAALVSRPAPIQALEWIPKVPAAERAAFEARTGVSIRERNAAGELVPVNPRDSYFPVTLVTPLEGNQAAVGFDLGSDAVRLESLAMARDTAELQVTHRITLVQETGEQFGFLAFDPVYRSGMPIDTIEQRREHLLGFALGVYRAGDSIGGALSVFDAEEVEVVLFDPSAPASEQLLAAVPFDAALASEVDPQAGGGRQHAYPIEVGGSSWTLVVRATPAFGSAATIRTWATLVSGLMFTTLVVLLVRSSLRRADQVQRQVVERTRELSTQRDRYQGIFENAIVGIFTTGPDNRIRTMNPAGLHVLDRSIEELVTMTPLDLVAPDHHQRLAEWRARRDAGDEVEQMIELPIRLGGSAERRWISAHLHPLFAPDGSFEGMQGVFHDIDSEIVRRDQLTEEALTDGLTGLPNRRRFDDFLEEQIAVSGRYGAPLSLLMIDLDHFKQINDQYGHPAGDAVLRATAQALMGVARDSDLVARYGGEEFTMILSHTGEMGAGASAQRCLAVIEAIECAWESELLSITASVGVATFDAALHQGAADLLRDADGAVYAAKHAGRNTVRVANDLAPGHRAA